MREVTDAVKRTMVRSAGAGRLVIGGPDRPASLGRAVEAMIQVSKSKLG